MGKNLMASQKIQYLRYAASLEISRTPVRCIPRDLRALILNFLRSHPKTNSFRAH